MTIELTPIPLYPLEGQDRDKDKDTQEPQPKSDLDLLAVISSSNKLTELGAWNLYLSHALSTWNARTYEFGAVSFSPHPLPCPQHQNPDNLLQLRLYIRLCSALLRFRILYLRNLCGEPDPFFPSNPVIMSSKEKNGKKPPRNPGFMNNYRGLCTTFAALCLSSFVGRWIDNAPSRIRTLLITISANRASVLLACLGWIFLVPGPIPSSSPSPADLLAGLIRRGRRTSDKGFTNNNDIIDTNSNTTTTKAPWIFVIVIVLGIYENLSGIGNMIAMEREWVPVLAAAAATTTVNPQSLSPSPGRSGSNHQAKRTKQSKYTLTHLNAVTRRIDLLCKLFAAVFISLVILSSSMFVGVAVVGLTSTVSWGIEVWCARRVWRTNPSLRRPKAFLSTTTTTTTTSSSSSSSSLSSSDNDSLWRKWIPSAMLFSRQKRQLQAFFATDIWMPALSLTILHFSVLAYSATFITFLLNSGFSLLLITSARVISSIVEVSSTFVAPLSIRYLAPVAAAAASLPGPTAGGKRETKKKEKNVRLGIEEEEEEEEEEEATERGEEKGEEAFASNVKDDDDEQRGFLLVTEDELNDQEEGCKRGKGRNQRHLVGLARSGLWGMSLQLGCLIPVVLAISQIHPASYSPSPLIITIPMFSFLCLSRLGLWVFDISIQELSQLCVPPDSLASFAGTSMSFVAGFELCQWVLVAIISKPEHFVWLGTISAATVGGALVMYFFWFVRRVGVQARERERDRLVEKRGG